MNNEMNNEINNEMNNETNFGEKKVSFSSLRDVWIIPNTDDIINDGDKNKLWWNHDDMETIKKTAIKELQTYIYYNNVKNIREVSKKMWCELDFDKIYEIMDEHKINEKIELKNTKELYTPNLHEK